MRKSTVTQLFVEEYYGSLEALHSALKADWWKVQENWSFYIDGLCRDSLITMEQYHNWTFPWPR